MKGKKEVNAGKAKKASASQGSVMLYAGQPLTRQVMVDLATQRNMEISPVNISQVTSPLEEESTMVYDKGRFLRVIKLSYDQDKHTYHCLDCLGKPIKNPRRHNEVHKKSNKREDQANETIYYVKCYLENCIVCKAKECKYLFDRTKTV